MLVLLYRDSKAGCAYCSLSGVVETEEEQFGVLVSQAQAGQHVPDCKWSAS